VVEATVEMVLMSHLLELMDLTAATTPVVVVEVVDQDQPVELVVQVVPVLLSLHILPK
jgi:hypothetical protein